MRIKIKTNHVNPLKDVFFPVEDDILFTVGRRTPKGVARGDACGMGHGILCEALLRVGDEKDYRPTSIKGHQHNFVQVVDPGCTKKERINELIGVKKMRDMNLISAGGFGNLDAMISQHPTQWSYPYSVNDMRKARAIPERSNFVWGYPEAAEDQGIDTFVDYTWQDMVAGKGANGPWQWTLLEVFPSGKTREILKVGEVPGSLIHDAVLISVG